MIELLRDARITGWRRQIQLHPKLSAEDVELSVKRFGGRILTRPDFLFRTSRLALFVDGCFWHRCPLHSTAPTQNAEFWLRKIARNVHRDGAQARALEAAGWKVLRIWEHELREPEALMRRLLRHLDHVHV